MLCDIVLFPEHLPRNNKFCCFQMIIADAEEDENVSKDGDESRKMAETAVAPWVGYNEEETMKAQILALSKVVVSICLVILGAFFIA